MAGPTSAKNRVVEQQNRSGSSRPAQSSSGSSSSSGGRTLPPPSTRSGAPSARSQRTQQGYDGASDPVPSSERDPNTSHIALDLTKKFNFDLGLSGWATVHGTELTSKPARPPPSKLGQPSRVGLNTYHVESFPNIVVYQYDVMIGNGVEKRGAIQKVWHSKAVRAEMGDFTIFDGNKLAWSGKSISREIRLTVDLDAEEGRTPKVPNDKNKFRVAIRQTNKVGFQQLMAHLQGKAQFDNTCLEAINFADQLLRMTPAGKYSAIKRAFFKRGEKRFDLGGGIEAFKGVYQSLRLVHPGRLSINVDVANGTFWTAQKLIDAATAFCGANRPEDLINVLRGGEKSVGGQKLRKLRKMHVIARHRGKQELDHYVIDSFIYKSPKDYKFQITENGKEVEMSLYQYFMKKYNVVINFTGLPLVKMTKGKNTVLPMEVLMLRENQRYQYKLDDRQTSNMIKFAVTAPPERYAHITEGLKMLDWPNDPVLNKYGVKVSTTKTTIDGRVLVAPTVKFGVGDAKPGTSGRWDLKGKKFLASNPTPLKSWAVCVIPGRRGGKPDKSAVENFIKTFTQGYVNHGGKVENKQPAMVLGSGSDVGGWVTQTWNAAGNQVQARPQILLFILPDKDSQVYGRIKRSCECRYGVVSQCVQYAHAQKAAPQYISNVLMKFNCKLGGATCRAIGPKTGSATGIFQVPTVIVGADVSHAAPGSQAASMAAMTVSIDKLATRYAAIVQTNGYHVEMINTDIIKTELKPMLQHWIATVGGGKLPQHFIYLRDGVSEGQYNKVIQEEVADMKQLLKVADPANTTKFVVVIGSKRHHVRFFPEKGDRNGNPFPGTLVETGVTNPFENDFYLCSHAAIKGTARPAHYYVLLNEANMSNDQLHTLLYEHAYQYQRASTPISQHPAIYYAHLASNRAVPHDPKWAGSTDTTSLSDQRQLVSQVGSQADKTGTGGSSTKIPDEFDKLMPMPNQGAINTSMWYI